MIYVHTIYSNEIIECLKEFNQEKEREKNIYSHDKLDEISQRCNKILNKYSISELEHVYRTNSTFNVVQAQQNINNKIIYYNTKGRFQENNKQLLNEINKLRKDLTIAQEEAREANRKYLEIKEKLEKEKELHADTKKQLKEAEEEHEKLQKENEKEKKKNNELEEENRKLEKIIKELKRDHEIEINQLKQKIKDKDDEINNIKNELDRYKNKFKTQKNIINKLENERDELKDLHEQ
ncbi:7029_t:CDS:2, partial [Scutellospora calospora]